MRADFGERGFNVARTKTESKNESQPNAGVSASLFSTACPHSVTSELEHQLTVRGRLVLAFGLVLILVAERDAMSLADFPEVRVQSFLISIACVLAALV